MNKLWIALSVLLAGCNSGSDGPTPSVYETPSTCNTAVKNQVVDPGLACYEANDLLVTAEDFGDSTSLGWSVAARHDLCGVVDFRHDPWSHTTEDLCGKKWNPYDGGQFVATAFNNGYSTTELEAAEREFSDPSIHRNVIIYNSGYHDMQRGKRGTVNIPLDVYRNNMEALAQTYEQHGDIVIWVDTLPILGGIAFAGHLYMLSPDIRAYNAVAREVAREHGFYRMSWNDIPEHLPNQNVHLSGGGYNDAGSQVANCIITALNQGETDDCHR